MMTDQNSGVRVNTPAEVNPTQTSKSSNSPVDNPYDKQPQKPSYKDALLAEVEGAKNRLGVDTFKLTHLIYKTKQQTEQHDNIDKMSTESDAADSMPNETEWYTYRMRFQITLPETTQETFMEDLVQKINQVLEVINLNTLGVKLAPWHTSSVKKETLRTELSEDMMEAIKYLYGFKAGMSRPGPQYFRINLAIPSHFSPDDIERKNKNSIMIPGQQSLLKANSQSINPVTIGWLLRSNPTMADVKELEELLRVLWTVKGGFGLYWATVKTHQVYNPQNTTRAIHIETEEDKAKRLTFLAGKAYGVPSTNIEDYPIGCSMMFVKHYNMVQGAERENIAKLAMYQKTNESMVTSAAWLGSLALDRSVSTEKFQSLRHWLMSMTSLVEKTKKDGSKYCDKLFQSIHRSKDMQETRFYFYSSNSKEASNIISALPLVVQKELGLDPACFFHKADYAGILEGKWNSTTQEFKTKQTLNQEQFLNDLDECFLINKAFLLEVVIMGKSSVDKELVDKTMAMANGEDDVSVLSQLTDKTLKAVTSRSGQTSPSNSSVNSQQSGNTSKSKTQAAVKEALKDVSLQHNKAMKEQHDKFRREIEALRQKLQTQSTVTSDTTPPRDNSKKQNDSLTADVNAIVVESDTDMPKVQITVVNESSPTRSPIKSPVHKRPKRGRGGRSSSTNRLDE
jgi:hypothetical protein